MRISSLLFALATIVSPLRAASPLFPGGGGNYGGILEADFSGDPDDSGILTVVLNDNGASTIKLFWQGQVYGLKATFDENGQLTKDFPKRNDDQGTQLQLFCFLDTSSRTISGVLTDPTATNGIFSLSGAKPDPTVGPQLGTDLRTGFLELPNSKPAQESNGVRGLPSQEVDEDAFALVRIAKSSQRSGRFVGQLPDTTKYSAGSPLRGLQYALRAGLYSQKKKGSGGQLLGLGDVEANTFAPGADLTPRGNDGDGAAIVAAFRWHKKRNLPNGTSYPDGIDQRLGLETVHYRGNKDLSFVLTGERHSTRNATLEFHDGNLGTDLTAPGPNPFSVGLSVTFFGAKIVGENPFKVKLTVKPLTARFSGSFRHPDTGETVKFTGAFRSAQGIVPGEGRGNFISFGPQPRDPANAQSGSVRFTLD